jgi:hypothetical protein
MSVRHRTLIEQSRVLIAASLKRIAQTRRRLLFAIQGGSTALAEPPAAAPSASTPAGEVPRIFAGLGSGNTRCSACGVNIPEGAPEYEIVSLMQTMFLDRTCFVAWHNGRHPG